MGELVTWLLAAAVLGLLAGGLIWWRRADAQRAEAEREAQRRAEAAAEAQRQAAERAEAERSAARQAECERAAAAEREAQRQAERLAEQQRQMAEEAERERLAALAEAQRLTERRVEQERLAAERAGAERAAAAQAQRERSAAAEAEAEAQRLAAERAAPPPAVKSPAQTLVLVADDSKVVRIKTGRLLAQHQYQVSYASDGLDAVQQLQANPPDVLITDVEMPGMDGFELTRHIRGNPQTAQLPVIMITAADDRHRAQADAAGVSVLLGKPYPEDTLIAQIRLAMGQDVAEPA